MAIDLVSIPVTTCVINSLDKCHKNKYIEESIYPGAILFKVLVFKNLFFSRKVEYTNKLVKDTSP